MHANEKNVPNSQKNSVFWLVAVGIHNLRGISPYGDHGGTLGIRRGSKTSKNLKKRPKKQKNRKKMSESIYFSLCVYKSVELIPCRKKSIFGCTGCPKNEKEVNNFKNTGCQEMHFFGFL